MSLAVQCSVHGHQPADCPECTAERAIAREFHQGRPLRQVESDQIVGAYAFIGLLFGVGLTLVMQAVWP